MTLAYGTMSEIGRFNFVVRDNIPISVAVWSPISRDSTPEPILNFQSVVFHYDGFFPKNLTDYTIDGLFDYTARKLTDQPMTPLVTMCGITEGHPAEVTFDEQYGYIKSLSYDDCGHWNVGGGLLCGGLGDCYSGVRILDFELLK